MSPLTYLNILTDSVSSVLFDVCLEVKCPDCYMPQVGIVFIKMLLSCKGCHYFKNQIKDIETLKKWSVFIPHLEYLIFFYLSPHLRTKFKLEIPQD